MIEPGDPTPPAIKFVLKLLWPPAVATLLTLLLMAEDRLLLSVLRIDELNLNSPPDKREADDDVVM